MAAQRYTHDELHFSDVIEYVTTQDFGCIMWFGAPCNAFRPDDPRHVCRPDNNVGIIESRSNPISVEEWIKLITLFPTFTYNVIQHAVQQMRDSESPFYKKLCSDDNRRKLIAAAYEHFDADFTAAFLRCSQDEALTRLDLLVVQIMPTTSGGRTKAALHEKHELVT